MNATIYFCPDHRTHWRYTDAKGSWELLSGQAQHFKNVQQRKCPDCAAKKARP
jgi:hypothetical protein